MMRKALLGLITLVLATHLLAQGYLFTTLAGRIDGWGATDGAGDAARFRTPAGIVLGPDGKIYVSDESYSTIRIVTTSGVVTTLAGSGSGSADGPVASATFGGPGGLATDAQGNLYVSDTYNHTVRKISVTGIVTTLAGLPGQSGSIDGSGSGARFNRPAGLAVDGAGNIYVADRVNNTIRKITSQGVVTTFAGAGGISGAGDGAGAEARFNSPWGVAFDRAGTLFVADMNNHLIRRITPGGVVTTVAGLAGVHGQNDGPAATTALYLPSALTVDEGGTIFFAEPNRVRRLGKDGYIVTLAGSAGGRTADGVGAAAGFERLLGIAVDSNGILYVTDGDNSVVKKGVAQPLAIIAQPQGGIVRVGAMASLSVGASGLAPLTYQWFKDGSPVLNATGPELKLAGAQLSDSGVYSVVIGDGGRQVTSQSATLKIVVVPPNDLFGSATPLTGAHAAITATNEGAGIENGEWQHAGQNAAASVWWSWTAPIEATGLAGRVTIDTMGSGIDTLLAVYDGSELGSPWAVASEASPEGAHRSEVEFTVTPGTTYKIVVDGRNGQMGALQLKLDYTAPQAPILQAMSPNLATVAGSSIALSVQVDGGIPIYYRWRRNGTPLPFAPLPDYSISQLSATNAGTYDVIVFNALGTFVSPPVTVMLQPEYAIATLAGQWRGSGSVDGAAGTARFSSPQALAIDQAGNLYVADTGNYSIRKVTPDGVVSTIAGTYGRTDGADGVGKEAHFDGPAGIAVDSAGNVYVADTGNHTIRKITPAAVVTTLAGSWDQAGSTDGTGAAARFKEPMGLAVDSAGNVFVADSGNHTLRRITPAGVVTTVAGKAGTSGMVDGSGSVARFYRPRGVAIGPEGRIYVVGSGNNVVRAIDVGSGAAATADVRTIAGSGRQASTDGAGYDGAFTIPLGIAVDAIGNLYVSELFRLRKVTPQGAVSTIAGISAPFDYPYGVAVNAAGKLFLADSNNHVIRAVTPPKVPQVSVAASGAAVPGAAWIVQASVTSEDAVTYQWNKNGVALDGATQPSFRIEHVVASDAAFYTVTVTNASGSFGSAAVELRLAGTLTVITAPADTNAHVAGDAVFYVAVASGSPATFHWQVSGDRGVTWANVVEGPVYRGVSGPVLTLTTIAAERHGERYRCVVGNDTAALTTTSALLTIIEAPRVTAQPQNQIAAAGGSVSLGVVFAANPEPAILWQRNGVTIDGPVGPRLTLTDLQPASAGLYAAYARNGLGLATSLPAIVGVSTTLKVIGAGREVGANVLHPNGNRFDQVLVTGAAESITADRSENQITRTSFIDLDDDIVQVEFSGAGTLTLVLTEASTPAWPTHYTQEVEYVKGHAGIIITGADETTNVAVFSVGRATAFDPTGNYNILKAISETNDPAKNGSPLFAGHQETAYDGIADIAFIAIASTNGKFGGVRTANANYFAHQGYTGIYAPGVTFQGPVYAGNISAFDSAVPVLMLGAALDATKITGGDLLQGNGWPVQVSGLTQLRFEAGSDSHGRRLPASPNQGVLQEDGRDVTAELVVNP